MKRTIVTLAALAAVLLLGALNAPDRAEAGHVTYCPHKISELWHNDANPDYHVWAHIECQYREGTIYPYVDGISIGVRWQYWNWNTYTWQPSLGHPYDSRSCGIFCVKLGTQANHTVSQPAYGGLVCRRGRALYLVWEHLGNQPRQHLRTSAGICI